MVSACHNEEALAYACILGFYSGPWAQIAQWAALRDAAGQCLNLLKEKRARPSSVISVSRPVAQTTPDPHKLIQAEWPLEDLFVYYQENVSS